MYNLIKTLFNVSVKLLNREASKHGKASAAKAAKAKAHYERCLELAHKRYEREAAYRHGLDQQADIHQRHADRASALASKIKGVLE